jgi:HAMP domain-containing protein/putative methionine-R-sulfoxide reductase with GAF domain
MRKWILGLKIRAKLLAAFGSILLFSILLIVISVNSINQIIDKKGINEKVEMLKLSIQSQEFAIKEFTYEGFKEKKFLEIGKSPFLDSYDSNLRKGLSILNDLKQNFKDTTVSQGAVSRIEKNLLLVRFEFDSLRALLRERGFKDYGIEGSLRKAIHKIEDSKVKLDMALLLTLRRNEKDFFLRRDLKYKAEFLTNIETFRTKILTIKDPTVQDLLQNLQNYKEEFIKIVDIETKIGLKLNEGIRGKLNEQLNGLRRPLDSFSLGMKLNSETQTKQIVTVLWIVFAIQLIAGVFLAIFYADLISKAIKEIRNAMQSLANGVFPDKLEILTTEEIGQTKIALNHFLERLHAATSFAHKMGDGELNAMYDDRFNNDVLAKSIIQMQQKLREAEEKQSKINWINVGAAKFTEIIKNESEDIASLGDKILALLIKYLNINQGALYIIQDDKLLRISTYAFGKKKFQEDIIEIGQGLVGQCALEGNTIILKEIPRDYVKITSGLGEATPKNVIIVPIKWRDEILGTVELASFEVLEQFKIEFIERISENIASLIFNKQNASRTQILLKQSQERAEILSQQEEEMRQNAEELQATQEEMERQKMELELEITKLKSQLKLLTIA